MKKLILTTAILLGMTLGVFADGSSNSSSWLFFNLFNPEENMEENNDGLFENNEFEEFTYEDLYETPILNFNPGMGGLFGRGNDMNTNVGDGFRTSGSFLLPSLHGQTDDSSAPLGGGVVVLMGLGAAYLVAKKRRED